MNKPTIQGNDETAKTLKDAHQWIIDQLQL